MTQDPEHPASTGPTPEEISARLEALLKRTHALRQSQRPVSPDDPAWPPSDHDLATVEVVDVAAERPAAVSAREQRLADADGSASAAADSGGEASATGDDRPSFGRPDWSTLRMRETTIDVPRTPAWVWLLVAALVLALGLETAYLLRTTPWAASGSANDAASGTTALAAVTLHVDGPSELAVSADGGDPRALPATIPMGRDADLRLVIERVTDGAAASPAPAATGGPAPAPATPPSASSATRGAVHIESTPTGAIVTMEGRERGPTPITIEGLRPGRHDVLVVGPAGGRMFRVDVTAGTTARLDAVLPTAQ